MASATEKRCTVCAEVKPLHAFHRHRGNSKDGRRGRCRECTRAVSAARYAADPSRHRAAVDRCRYGLEPGDFEAMRKAQEARCAICGRHEDDCPRHHPTARGLHIDHDHATGKVRGLLCLHCNLALGYLEKAGARVTAAAAYLEGGQ